MDIKFEHGWDWEVFSTPAIEAGKLFGYPYIMLRLAWFWCSLDFRKGKNPFSSAYENRQKV